MKGVVLDFNNKENIGLILGEDGNRYTFDYEKEWINKNKLPKVDLDIQFEKQEKQAINVILDEQVHATSHNYEKYSNPKIDNNIKVKKKGINKAILFILAITGSLLVSIVISTLFLTEERVNQKFENIWMYPEDLKIFMKVKSQFNESDCNVTFRIKDKDGNHQKEIVDFRKVKTIIEKKSNIFFSTLDNKFYKVEISDYGIKNPVLLNNISSCIRLR